MTEAEWQVSDQRGPMLEAIRQIASDRKLRLFACASARSLLDLLSDRRARRLLDSVEQFADGLCDLAVIVAGADDLFAATGAASPSGRPITPAESACLRAAETCT